MAILNIVFPLHDLDLAIHGIETRLPDKKMGFSKKEFTILRCAVAIPKRSVTILRGAVAIHGRVEVCQNKELALQNQNLTIQS